MLLSLAAKLLGINKILAAINGKKAAIGGIAQILAGGSAVLAGASCLLRELAAVDSAVALLDLAKGVAHDQCALTLIGGVALIGSGIGDIGNRHAIKKMEDKVVGQAVP